MAQFVNLLVWQVTAELLNIYYRVDGDAASTFFVHEGLWKESRRWGVVRVLLEDMGCASRRCDMAEVGVYAGETSLHVLQRLQLLHLHGVDPYAGFEEQPSADESV